VKPYFFPRPANDEYLEALRTMPKSAPNSDGVSILKLNAG
jgi:hypothetical protein